MRPGIEYTQHYRNGYDFQTDLCAHMTAEAIQERRQELQHVIDRETVEPDHPGNMRPESLDVYAGRVHAIDDYLNAQH